MIHLLSLETANQEERDTFSKKKKKKIQLVSGKSEVMSSISPLNIILNIRNK